MFLFLVLYEKAIATPFPTLEADPDFCKSDLLANTYLYISGYELWKGGHFDAYLPVHAKTSAKNHFCIFKKGPAPWAPGSPLHLVTIEWYFNFFPALVYHQHDKAMKLSTYIT